MDAGRNSDGTFKHGHSGIGGRKPKLYSIAMALTRFADQPESVDDDGNPVTAATMAGRWLWTCVLTGRDGTEPIRFRDRLAAFVEIRRAIEPDPRGGEVGQSDDQQDDFSLLNDDELRAVEQLLRKAAGNEQ